MTIQPAAPPVASAARVGLALGSGSARGLAHIGVIRALEEAGIRIDCVAGTSMGALIGAIQASGKLKDMEATFMGFDWKKTLSFFDFVLPKSGMLDGARISELVRAHVHAEAIEHLPTPFSAVATDILTGDEITLRTGDVIEAVRASISVPGIFTPVRSNGRVLVDGGLCNPVPVSAAREMGASFIIGVDLNHEIIAGKNLKPLVQPGLEPASKAGDAQNGMLARWGASYRQSMLDLKQKLLEPGTPGSTQWSRWLSREESLPSVFEVLLASINIMETGITRSRLAADRPDLIIRPPLGHIRFLEFARAAEIITIGYEHTRSQLAALPPATLAIVRDRAA